MNPPDDNSSTANPAADLIRQKLSSLYTVEPDAAVESAEVAAMDHPHSKHQAFMYELNTSGKSLSEIQDAWHAYYTALPDTEKHQVWNEFYASHPTAIPKPGPVSAPIKTSELPHSGYYKRPRPAHRPVAFPEASIVGHVNTKPAASVKKRLRPTRSVTEIKQQVLSNVRSRQKLSAKHHFQSLLFGLGVGSVVMLILLFGFFNERFIAPFITPSRQVSATPIILTDSDSAAVDPEPRVIIPKINVEIPVVYDEPSIAEKAVENALERGVVHYATTPSPGEQGNVVIFGHSSNNIFNKGRYKFAFVLLSRLENGDVFYLTKDSKRYAYRVYEKKIVVPTEVGVLGAADKPNTATLITCDPPGTSLNRLVVTAEQISPDPAGNGTSTAIKTAEQPKVVPSNSPSLWQRLTDWL